MKWKAQHLKPFFATILLVAFSATFSFGVLDSCNAHHCTIPMSAENCHHEDEDHAADTPCEHAVNNNCCCDATPFKLLTEIRESDSKLVRLELPSFTVRSMRLPQNEQMAQWQVRHHPDPPPSETPDIRILIQSFII